MCYLHRWWNSLGDDQPAWRRPLAVVVDNQIARIPNAIGILRSVGCILRNTAIASHRGMNDPVLKLDLLIVDSQRLEKLGSLARRRVDGHFV